MKDSIKKTKKQITTKNNKIKECVYKVKGMHCASCEVLIEKKLIKQVGIESTNASTSNNEVIIEYTGVKPDLENMNKLFHSEGYTFSENNTEIEEETIPYKENLLKMNSKKLNTIKFIAVGLLLVFLVYKLLERLGIASLISVSATSTLPAFFLFGIVAGFSSCAALVGGIVLSMSKQWYELHSKSNSLTEKLQPHFLFNIGRIVSFALLGGVLGAIGSVFTLSTEFTAVVAILVAILMIFLGLQLLGVKGLEKFQFRVPKVFSRYIADESNFSGKYMPLIMGALTFFLPCGFTITAQGLAMVSGDPIRGALIMALFALGTSPMLLFLGLSSTKLYEKIHVAENFMKLVGILVVFFGISTINMQLLLLGLPNLSDLNIGKIFASPLSQTEINSLTENIQTSFPNLVEGKQIIKMDASTSGYSPNYFKLKVNIPVRWEITDKGTSGCTNAIISKGLFEGQINLTDKEVSIKEFTPTKTGKFRFSCWMGMVTGIIEVVDESSPNTTTNNATIEESGAKGCGCGGGGSKSCKGGI